MTTYEEILEELQAALLVEDLESIEDRQGEFIENWVPIYNGDVLKEWAEMPSDYDDTGWTEFGVPESATIIARMSADLYLYYSDLFHKAFEELGE